MPSDDSPPTLEAPDRAATARSPRPSWRLAVFAACFVLQIAVYHQSFQVMPAADDFTNTYGLRLGDRFGPGWFFTDSISTHHFRPFKYLGLWLAMRVSPEQPWFWIRAVHFVGMASFAWVALLWANYLRLGRGGTVIAALALMLHPVLPQALASIDGMDSLFSSAFLWLGALYAVRYAERLNVVILTTAACFLLGVGFKEYVFGLVPLAALAVLIYRERDRWRSAILVGVALSAVMLAVLVLRHFVTPPGAGQGTSYIAVNPVQWGANAALFATSLLFFGSSLWVYVNQSIPVFAVVALACGGAFAAIAVGLWMRDRHEATYDPDRRGLMAGAYRKSVVFLLLSFAAASFPANIMFHVSEMYVPPIVLPFVLLCGLAADGWAARGGRTRAIIAVMAAVALVCGALAARQKVAGLVDVGRVADQRLRQMSSLIPDDLTRGHVLVLYRAAELPPRRSYGVFRIGDELLIDAPRLLDKTFPERDLLLSSKIVEDPATAAATLPEAADADLVLVWDAPAGVYRRLDTAPASRPAATAPAAI